ncbi:hypothetical protein AK830_g6004 [Neonectria ditissima]|uniref:Uncharacterized protein n=1 Tax=Neonectria ditissima TaxID=78410 RepID=A0A0P7ARX8_9HYPO|nr:hypothetical protein AK830_g6004 [Neonectria ditissima]
MDLQGVEVNSKDNQGYIPLLWAVKGKHESIVGLLLTAEGVKVNPKDNDDQTPLIWAIEFGHEAIVKMLLATEGSMLARKTAGLLLSTEGIQVNSKSKIGQTPLFCAILNNNEANVKLLLTTAGVEVDTKDICVEVVKLLLANEKVDPDSKTTIYGDDCGDYKGPTPRSYTAAEGHDEVVKLLLATNRVNSSSRAVDICSYEYTPLSFAAQMGHVGVVKLILATGKADPNFKTKRSTDAIPVSRADLDLFPEFETSSGFSALLYAVDYQEATVKLLLDSGKVDADSESDLGRTPFSQCRLKSSKRSNAAVVFR